MKSKNSIKNISENSKKAYVVTKISLPEFTQFPKIDAFYKKLSSKCHTFCESSLPLLYNKGNLIYCVRTSHEQSGDLLTIKLRVSLTDRQAMRLLFSDEQTHIWQTKYQCLIKLERKQNKYGTV